MLIAGPNLSLDRTVTIEELRPGEVLRFDSATVTPGGKGVNVARAARALGFEAALVGFAPGRTGRAVQQLLADEGTRLIAVPTAGEVRCATIVLEPGGRVTVLNEPGPAVTEDRWEELFEAVRANLAGQPTLVVIGSAPPGTSDDAYGRLVRIGQEGPARVLVDATGPLLAGAIEAGPDVVSPNLAEAEGLLLDRRAQPVEDDSPDVPVRALAAAAGLRARGALAAVVTAGAAGLAVDGPDGAAWLPAPRVTVRNPIGAGDSFVAGFVGALEGGASLRTAAVAGQAVAAASVETGLAGSLDPDRARAFEEAAPKPGVD